MSARRSVLVYRDELLGESETFILAQSESLTGYEPFYLGLRRRPGLRLPESRVYMISRPGLAGKASRARFKLLGPNRRLQSLLSAVKPSLVHAHFAPDGCNAMSLARRLEVPLIVSLHGYDVTLNDSLAPRLYTLRRRRLFAQASKFICISEFIRRAAIAKGFPDSKLLVHYTGIDTALFQADPASPRTPVILFVGRLVPKKGCQYLIRAMARVQQSIPAALLVVIGDGPLRAELEQQAASQLKDFTFLGPQEPAVVRQWMNRALIFSVPSVVAESGDAEGFGMVFAEAQAMGLPVVSFATGGLPEAVENNRSGFLVPERDWEALADKLVTLLLNPDLRTQFGKAGRSRVVRLFNLQTQSAALESIYDEAVAGGHCSPLLMEASIEPPAHDCRETFDLKSVAGNHPVEELDVHVSQSRQQ